MNGFGAAIPFPAVTGETTRAKSKLDHRSTEEAALVRRVQAQDEMAFREVVERYQAKVFSIIYGILRNRNDAEDIAQQVFAKIYFSIKNFDFRSSLLTWIYKITVNECYDYLRKKRVRKLVYESDFSAEDSQRMETSDPATDHRARCGQAPSPARFDTQIAGQDFRRRPLAHSAQRSGRAFGGRAGGYDRHERKHHQGETIPRTSKVSEGCPAA